MIKGVLIILLGICLLWNLKLDSKVHEYQEYYNNTEVLLDSIDAWYPDFADSGMETDTYYDYEVCKNKIIK